MAVGAVSAQGRIRTIDGYETSLRYYELRKSVAIERDKCPRRATGDVDRDS